MSLFGCESSAWLRAGHKCYYFQSSYRATWEDGLTTCVQVGANFIKTETVDEKVWLANILNTLQWQAYWSGLNDRDKEGTWVWADGSTPDSTLIQWNQEPNDMAGDEDCAMLMPDGVFNDGRCLYKAGYICEAFPEDTPCPSNWIDQDAACYLFQPATFDNVSLTWYEARDRCRDLAIPTSGFLLAISGQSELEFVVQSVMGFGQDATAFWTGLNDRFNEGIWTYDQDFNNPPEFSLIQWNTEPNGGPDSNCGVIMSGGRYDDQNCNAKYNFICEKPVKGSSYLRYTPPEGSSGSSGSSGSARYNASVLPFTLIFGLAKVLRKWITGI